MTPEEISTLFSAEGLYVLADGRTPGCTAAVMTVRDPVMECRRVFMMTVGEELSRDPAVWRNNVTTSLAGGPFSIQACKQIEKDAQELHDLQSAVAEAKELLMMYRDALLKREMWDVAQGMQTLLDTLTIEKK